MFLPLNQWANIQVTLDQGAGVTVMVFNPNGERQQVVSTDKYLAEQRPTGDAYFFKNFIGLVKSLHVWEKFMRTPVRNTQDNN